MVSLSNKNVFLKLFSEMSNNKTVSLATIIETKGSSPQVPGVSAIFSPSGLIMGTLGGGVLEARSQQLALDAIKNRRSILVEFNLASEALSEEEAICGGQVKVLIDQAPEKHSEVFQDLIASYRKRIPGILATVFGGTSTEDDDVHILRHWIGKNQMDDPNSEFPFGLPRETLLDVLIQNKPGLKGNSVFLEPVFPLPQLLIAGAGHIGQAITHLGALLNFDVTVVDDRAEYANAQRLPEADHIIVGDIEQALKDFSILPDTYIVIVTRGHMHDTEVLKNCISSPAAYIGMIGSRRKIALIKKEFLEKGWATQQELASIHSPIGLEIHSKTVEEIAVSIAAELVLVRNQSQMRRGET